MNKLDTVSCPLCSGACELHFVKSDGTSFYDCCDCRGIHLPARHWLSPSEEKVHYLTHNNDVYDPRYRSFVSPIVEAILSEQSPYAIGLDYGAGPGPVISKMLEEESFQTKLFDPFFHPDPSPLNDRYEYIICTEVIEHFQKPYKEFKRLSDLLKPQGTLYCMTELYHDGIDFAKWRYKNDPTHVFFYRSPTMDWIAHEFGFHPPEIDGRRIILRRK